MPAHKPGFTLSDALSNAEARELYRTIDKYLERTGTIWARLANAAGLSASIRAVVLAQDKGMLRRTHDALVKAMHDNPDGIAAPEAGKREFMSPADTAIFAAELRAYIERTDSDIARIARMMSKEPRAMVRLMSGPPRTSPAVAARLRKLMAEHPDGIRPDTGRKYIAPVADIPSDQQIHEKREATARMRQQRFDELNAQSLAKYGRPLGKPLSEMPA